MNSFTQVHFTLLSNNSTMLWNVFLLLKRNTCILNELSPSASLIVSVKFNAAETLDYIGYA